MIRTDLLKKLKQYKPSSESDQKNLNLVIRFVEENSNCFERSNLAGHITGSAWILNHNKTKVLLCHHKKFEKWIQLGGHADGESDILKVALKEAIEESGLKNIKILSEEIFDLDVHIVPIYKNIPAHFHYDIRFSFEANDQENFIVSDESLDLQWFDFGDVPNNLSLQRMVQKTS